MTTGKRDRPAGAPFGRSDPALLARPLEFIQAEHLRHRALCQAAEDMAEAPTLDRDLASSFIRFLDIEMALHVIDEEEDLFPVLRRRLQPVDDAERIIALLSGEHAADEALTKEIAAGLARALEHDVEHLEEGLRNALLTFADRLRRHLTVENAIVLPLAGRRLSKRDLGRIASRMAARRNLKLPGSSE